MKGLIYKSPDSRIENILTIVELGIRTITPCIFIAHRGLVRDKAIDCQGLHCSFKPFLIFINNIKLGCRHNRGVIHIFVDTELDVRKLFRTPSSQVLTFEHRANVRLFTNTNAIIGEVSRAQGRGIKFIVIRGSDNDERIFRIGSKVNRSIKLEIGFDRSNTILCIIPFYDTYFSRGLSYTRERNHLFRGITIFTFHNNHFHTNIAILGSKEQVNRLKHNTVRRVNIERLSNRVKVTIDGRDFRSSGANTSNFCRVRGLCVSSDKRSPSTDICSVNICPDRLTVSGILSSGGRSQFSIKELNQLCATSHKLLRKNERTSQSAIASNFPMRKKMSNVNTVHFSTDFHTLTHTLEGILNCAGTHIGVLRFHVSIDIGGSPRASIGSRFRSGLGFNRLSCGCSGVSIGISPVRTPSIIGRTSASRG